MLADVRFASRQIAKAPAFAGIVIGTLALGIGACVTMFSFVESVLLANYGRSGAAHVVFTVTRPPSNTLLQHSSGDCATWMAELKSVEQFVAFANWPATLTGNDEPRRVGVRYVTPAYLPYFDSTFARGRNFNADEFAGGRDRVVVVSTTFWRTVLGGDPGVVGRSLTLDGQSYTVVGV